MNIRRLVILTLVLLGSVAYAGPKQKMAVLGIEAVIGANGQIDPQDVAFAKELTKELRSRVNNSTQYDLTKDQRELSDEKLMNNCGAEHPSCMAPIGQSMGAEVMLFGKVENAKGGYKVSLKLVSVGKKQQIASDPNAFIAAGDTKGVGLATWVREHYRKLTGEGSDGTLNIRVAGATTGTVFVNGEAKDTLKSGSATLTLPDGRYRIGVEADGFKLWEQEGVTVSADKPVDLRPELVKKKDPVETTTGTENTTVTGTEGVISREGTVTKKKSKTIFKVAAAVGLGGAAITGALWGIQYFGPISDFKGLGESDFEGVRHSSGKTSIGQGQCGSGSFEPINASDTGAMGRADNANDKFSSACDGYDKTKILIPTTIALGLVGGAALVYVLVSKDDTEERVSGRQKKRRNLIVTPVVTPDGTGATLRFDW